MMMKNQRYRSCNHLTGLRFRLCGLPGGLPADYQKRVDGAKKEGKVVIYSTTDTKAAAPLIQGSRRCIRASRWNTTT